MKKLSEIPFINVSVENLMLANDMLDREQKGELLEMIIDAVLNNSSPMSENKCVSGVFNQFMAVINRKAESYANRVRGLDEYNKSRAKAVPEQRNEIVIEGSKKKEKKELPEVERWANAVINDTDGRGQEYFDKYWEKYFDSPQEADIYISNYETKII